MKQVNMLEAIKLLENKEEDEIIIARDNKPVAKITLYENDPSKRIGIAKEYFSHVDLDEFNFLNDEIAEDFYAG